jgi:hypothetical protein
MNEISVDRLILQAPGLSETEGRRLGGLIAEGLEALGAVAGPRDIPALRLDLTAPRAGGVDELARHVVAEIVRRVSRIS